ncbi:2Fe-2S iron-sulfur cluster-binding protein [Sinimarinibacterium flocculans]|nr:2Fe-2S iron-sulfur cluster-binding protein [Sinimarinibacterium flocculans]
MVKAEMKIHVKDRNGHDEIIECDAGNLLMRVLAERDFVDATCGGECSCGTCQVYVGTDHFARLSAPGEFERELLEGLTNTQPTSRLSCQITLDGDLDGLTLEIAKPE